MNKNQEILLHLDSGYNLARWLMRNEQDARDVVQDAFVRAFRFKGAVENPKTWFLSIVRNASYDALNKRLPLEGDVEVQDGLEPADLRDSPEYLVVQKADLEVVRMALLSLSEEQREIFVLREIEELSYQEIADTLRIPMGTAMSRLSRAHSRLAEALRALQMKGGGRE